VTILWLTCFDDWFDLYGPFMKNLAPRPLAKIPAFFARGQNPRWPPAPSWKIYFGTRALTIMYEYTFSTKSTTRIPVLASVWCYNIILTQIQDGRQCHLEKLTFEPEHLESCMNTLFRVNQPWVFRLCHQFDVVTSLWPNIQDGRHT